MGNRMTAPLIANGPMDHVPIENGPKRQTFCAMRFDTSRMTTKAVVRASRYLKLRRVDGVALGWIVWSCAGIPTSMPCVVAARQFLTETECLVSVGSGASAADAINLECPRRLARPRTPPFHGDNMSSNLIGDTIVAFGSEKPNGLNLLTDRNRTLQHSS